MRFPPFCAKSDDGKHCSCSDAISSLLQYRICCYCNKRIDLAPPEPEFMDDGSEENLDA